MVHFSQKKLHIGGILFLLFNEISINISWLEHPVFAFGFRTFKIKNYPCITFNKDIFNYCNRKSDSIWVQIESLLSLTYEKATPTILSLYYVFIKSARKTRSIIRAYSHIISVQVFLRFASRLSKR